MNVRMGFCARVVLTWAVLIAGTACFAADLILAENGRCDYQIVLPDKTLHEKIDRVLGEAADLMREMFKANGFAVSVVKEADADPEKPGIYLGDTAAARAAGVEVSALPVWSYLLKTSGKDVIIAGRDWPASGQENARFFSCSLGTVKGVTDFMREYCGTRFLAPGGSASIEFLPTERMAIPDNLAVRREPLLGYNIGRPTSDVASIGLNFLSNVTTEYFTHTHQLVIPARVYGKEHPEYFALINGQRLSTGPHLCYSNKDVQELIYRDMLRSFDEGYPNYMSFQADGFRGCTCDACKAMFDTGDWGEKLWLLNKMWAERLLKDRPGKFLIVGAYTVTEHPPKSFDKFPPNLRVCCRGTEEAFKEWAGRVPGGLVIYLHAWGPYHLCGYLPVRTPLYAEDIVRLYERYNVKGVGLDSSPANMWGMEGPTVYTYARMLDDPQNSSALELVKEYIQAAYGPAAPPMTRFFDELHHTLEAYARVFGVDNGTFQHYRRADGRMIRYLTWRDKLRLIGFLYPPETLERLESQLAQAERTVGLSDKQKLRLALARREFNYLNSTVRVVHMYNAYLAQKSPETLGQLLTEMEERRDVIMKWYDTTKPYRPEYYGKPIYLQLPISPDWPMYIGGAGYYQDHLLANGGSYLASPVPPFTWDIEKIRKAPLLQPKSMRATRSAGPLSLNSAPWNEIPSDKLGPLSLGGTDPKWPGEVKVAYDANALYVRFEGALPENWTAPAALKRDNKRIVNYESFTFLAAPDGNPARYYRFSAGVGETSMYDARRGFIEDSINPLFNRDDLTWNPDWRLESAVAQDGRGLQALMIIPFRSLGVAAPGAATEWKVNFSRQHQIRPGWPKEISLWSSNPGTNAIDDRQAFGTLGFE